MKKLFKTLTILLACLLYASSSSGQTWTIYDGNAKLTETNSTGLIWKELNTAGTLLTETLSPTGTLIWEATGTNRASRNTPAVTSNNSLDDTVTLMFRVKNKNTGTTKKDQGFQFEMYSYNIANNARYKTCFYPGGNDSIYFDNASTVTTADKRFYYPTANQQNWHTYRITTCNGTSSGSVITVYIDENTTPVATYTSKITTSNMLFIKTGCPNASWITSMKAEIDWMAWDTTGAYAPGTGTLPSGAFVDGSSSPSATTVSSFNFASPSVTGSVNNTDHTISLIVPYGTNITALTPTIATPSGSFCSPSGSQDFTNPVVYTIKSNNLTSTQTYTASVTFAPNTAKDITAFSVPGQVGNAAIDASAHTVIITLPYGVSKTSLTPTFSLSDQASAKVSSTAQVSGTTANDFSSPVIYSITAGDASNQNWTVTVNNEAPLTGKAITAFSFATPSATGIIDAGAKTVSIEVPYGTTVTGLVSTFTLSTAASAKVLTVDQVSGTTANNFTSPVTYIVTAQDGSTENWVVTVTVAAATDHDFTMFEFTSPDTAGIIDAVNHTVKLIVPYGTNLTALIPNFTVSGGATIDKASGIAQNFSSAVTYTITSLDQTVHQTWTVSVKVAKNTATNIVSFNFNGLAPAVIGSVNATDKKVSLTVPWGTDTTTLVPTITLSDNATVNPTSGTAKGFGLPKTYTVTADSTAFTQAWEVTVNVTPVSKDTTLSDLKVSGTTITGFVSSTYTYTMALPFGTTVVPTITATTSSVFANAAITNAASLPGSSTILVTAQNGAVETYTVNFTITPAATDATLLDLKVNGINIPAFASATTSYIYRVESGTTVVPTVTATKKNQFAATPVITAATAIPGSTTILVTAQDGSTKTYTIQFKFFEEWVKYDCSVRLDSVPGNPWNHTTSQGDYATISVVDDPDIAGNKLMSFDSKDSDKPLLSINPWAQLKDSAKITIVVRMKGKNLLTDKVSDLDLYYGKNREKWFPQRVTAAQNVDPISIKAEKRSNVQPVSDVDNWHIYRLVADTALGAQLYVDEKLTTYNGGMQKFANALAYKFAIGDGGGYSYSCYYDYIIWTKGAYAPGSGPAIPEEFSTAYYSDSVLTDLKVGGTTIPGFKKDSLNYSLILTSKTVPVVTATAHNGKASVVITPATQVPGTTKVEVTAQDGRTKAVYNVIFEFKDLTNPSLIGLKYGTTDVPGFNSDSLKYKVVLPAGTTTIPVIAGTKAWSGATAVYTQATALPGKATVALTSADGSTTKTYEVNFVVAKWTDASLSKIKSGIYEITTFKADTLKYKVILNAGTTVVPSVVATPKIAKSKVVVTLAATLKDTTKILVKAEDTTYTRTYTITYEVLKSKIATLDSIKLGDTSIPNFSKDVLSYNIELPIGTKTAPAFKVESTNDSAKIVITNATTLPGKAILMVVSEDLSDTVKYEINFTVLKSSDATLSGIKYGTTSVANFSTATIAYNITLAAGTKDVPVVTATPTYADAVVLVTPATALPGKTTIKVTSEDGLFEKTYELNFRVSTVGIETVSGNIASFYPNPATDALHIQLKKSATASISLVNMLGVQVINKNISGDKLTLDVSGLSKGMYFLKITSEGQTSTQKIEILK